MYLSRCESAAPTTLPPPPALLVLPVEGGQARARPCLLALPCPQGGLQGGGERASASASGGERAALHPLTLTLGLGMVGVGGEVRAGHVAIRHQELGKHVARI